MYRLNDLVGTINYPLYTRIALLVHKESTSTGSMNASKSTTTKYEFLRDLKRVQSRRIQKRENQHDKHSTTKTGDLNNRTERSRLPLDEWMNNTGNSAMK